MARRMIVPGAIDEEEESERLLTQAHSICV